MYDLPNYAWVLYTLGWTDIAISAIDSSKSAALFPKLKLMRCFILYGEDGPSSPELLQSVVECVVEARKLIDTVDGKCCIRNAKLVLVHAIFFLTLAAPWRTPTEIRKAYQSTDDSVLRNILKEWRNPKRVALVSLLLFKRLPLQKAFLKLNRLHATCTASGHTDAQHGQPPSEFLAAEAGLWLSMADTKIDPTVDGFNNVQFNGQIALCTSSNIVFKDCQTPSPLEAAKRLYHQNSEPVELTMVVV